MYELISNSELSENSELENEDLVEGMGSTAESGVKFDKEVPLTDLTGEPSDDELVAEKTRNDPILGTPQLPLVNQFAPKNAHPWDYQPFFEIHSQTPIHGSEHNHTNVTLTKDLDGRINSGSFKGKRGFKDNNVNQDQISYQSGAISVTNGVASIIIPIGNPYSNNNGAGPSNLTRLPGVGYSFVTLEDYKVMVDLVNTLNEEVMFLRNEKLYDAKEKDNLRNRDRVIVIERLNHV